MSDFAKDVKFSLKVVVNKEKTKVLFAEIGSDLADVLFSFLTLPLAKIVKILKKQYGDSEEHVFGRISTLYDCLSNLDSSHFRTEAGKQMLLNPTISFVDECRKLKLDIGDNQPVKYFTCENLNCSYPRSNNLGMYYDTVRCDCGQLLKREIPVMNISKAVEDGVFTTRSTTFIISDDLQILPNCTASIRKIIDTKSYYIIKNIKLNDAELNITFGFNEIIDLLKYSLESPTPLSNLVLKRETDRSRMIAYLSERIAIFNSVKVKVVLQKSTGEFLFAEVNEDFVEVLFSFLQISLGGLVCLFGFDTLPICIDNLYKCLAFPVDDKYLSLQRYMLTRPTIPYGFLSKDWIFSLTEEGSPELSYCKTSSRNEEYLTRSGGLKCIFKSPRGQTSYMKGPRKYIVKDDFTVMPLCLTSYIKTLSEQDISYNNVSERVLNIGSEEFTGILRSSLHSTSALSKSLMELIRD